MKTIELRRPYLLFLGAVQERGWAKTALGLRDWAGDVCLGELALPGASVSTGLPQLSLEQALANGAQSLVIGVAARGGVLEPDWIPVFEQALALGLDVVSGLHGALGAHPRLAAAAARSGARLIDVRTPPASIPIATGQKRSGRRLLTVGVDCAVGKKYTALALARHFTGRGVSATFRATGQTGIMIAGSGVPLDAVVADFIAGAAETLSPDAAPDHWDVVEGQGSLFHPSYAGVTLGLMHGSQPDVMVLCADVARAHILGLPDYPLPSLTAAKAAYETAAQLTNPAARVAAVSLNTSSLDEATALEALQAVTRETGLAACDPLRGFGLDAVADACLA
jgi:uncharacterized NAD-dependent epimerase/dehydratase family protein